MPRIVICDGCGEEREHYAKGLCQRCWVYQWRSENPEKVKKHKRCHYKKHREEVLEANCQWMDEHRERYREYKNQYNREHREEHGIYAKNWYQESREKILERSRQWAKRNPERYATNQKRWREENPERRAAIEACRKTRGENLPSTLTEEERNNLFLIGQGTYPNERLHLDHVIPISKGGGTTRANLHYIPGMLNSSKKDKLPQEAYKQLELWQ